MEWWLPGIGKRGMGSCLVDAEIRLGMMKNLETDVMFHNSVNVLNATELYTDT